MVTVNTDRINARFNYETWLPILWESRVISFVIKGPGREADHLAQTNIEVKNEWSYTSAPHGMHKCNFTLK